MMGDDVIGADVEVTRSDAIRSDDAISIDISSSLVAAYALSTLKDLLMLGSLFAVLYAFDIFIGREVVFDNLESVGIPSVWLMYLLIGLAVLVFGATFFNTLSLTSYELIFRRDALTYSYGSFFKVTGEAKITDVVRVNFKSYGYFGLGDILVELTGTEEKQVKVQYVAHVADVCGRVNSLIRQKKSGLSAHAVSGVGYGGQDDILEGDSPEVESPDAEQVGR